MFVHALLLTGALALAPAGESQPESKPQGTSTSGGAEATAAKDTVADPGRASSNASGNTSGGDKDASGGEPKAGEPKAGEPLRRPFDGVAPPSDEPVVTQSCDAQRAPAKADATLSCNAWRIEWTHKGKVWGAIVSNDLNTLHTKRARHLAFVRQYARVFDKPIDPRYDDPSPTICDQCDHAAARGRWGEGQTFSGLESARALESARERLTEFERIFYTHHTPGIAEVARLSGERKSASTAKRYAKQLDLAAGDIVAWQVDLDRAELVRSKSKVDKVLAAMRTRGAALDKGLDALGKQVAATVSKAHGGTYTQEGSTGASVPQLEVAFDGRKVTATYRVGEATSVWFEGEVALDGSIAGRSLMAPTGVKLRCPEHTEACGYAYIPSMIRFSMRAQPKAEVLELWFQRETWVRATPFSRS